MLAAKIPWQRSGRALNSKYNAGFVQQGLCGGLCAGVATELGISNATAIRGAVHPAPHESFFRYVVAQLAWLYFLSRPARGIARASAPAKFRRGLRLSGVAKGRVLRRGA